MAIATLTVDLIAKLGTIEQDLGRVGTIAQRQADQMQRAFAGVKSTLAGLGAGISLGGVVTAFKATTDALDKLNDAADATGASIESLSKLENVARRNGDGIELVSAALLRMNKALEGADEEGKGAAAVLKAIGLNAAELKNLDPADALQKVALAFNEFERDGNLARASQVLFGKSIAEVAPLMKDLAEAGKLNATVTREQAEQAEQFNKQLYSLKTNISNAARSIIGEMLPAMNNLVNLLKEAGALGSLSATIAKTRGLGASNAELIRDAQTKLDDLRRSKTEAGSLSGGGVVGLFTDAQISEYEGRIKALKELQKQEALAGAALLGDISGERRFNERKTLQIPPGVGETSRKSAGARRQAAKEDLDFLDDARRLAQELDKELAALEKREKELAAPIGSILARLREQSIGMREAAETVGMTQDEIARLTASQIEEAAVLAELNGAYDSQIESLLAVARGYRDVADAADKKRIADALQDTVTGKIEAQRREMEFFADALERGAISAEQFSEIATAKLGLVAEQAKETRGIAEELGMTFSSAFEDAIVNGSKLSDVLKAIEKDLIRIVARKAITEPLGNYVAGLFGGSSSSSSGSSGIGTALNLASAGSSFLGVGGGLVGGAQAFGAGLGLTASEAAAAAAAYTAAGYGGTAAAISSGAAIGGGTAAASAAGSALSVLAAAAPYIAAVVAIAAMFMGDGGGPKTEGSFDSKNIERFFTDSNSDAQAKAFVTGLNQSYIDLAKRLGGEANNDIRLAFGYALDPAGDAPNAAHLVVGASEFIRDEGRPEDFAVQAKEYMDRGLLAALRETDLYDAIDEMLDAFDPFAATASEVSAELAKINTAYEQITAAGSEYRQTIQSISEAMQGTQNMFADSIRAIEYGLKDASGKYAILDAEAARTNDVLKVLTDPTMIQEYARRLNDTMNTAFALLDPAEQSSKAEEFIAKFREADALTQERLQRSADTQRELFAALPKDIVAAIDEAMAKAVAAIQTAVQGGVHVDIRAPAGYEVGVT